MKHINKQPEPEKFTKWRKKNSHYDWDDFRDAHEYAVLKESLCREQEGLCCYCEISIEGSADTHIEHYKPQSKYSNEIYNYNNLFASCKKHDSCGHKKGAEYCNKMISPLDKDCEKKFLYTDNGQILPFDENDKHVQQTIDVLGLNCDRLKNFRRDIFKTLKLCDDSDVVDSLVHCREWYNGFYTLIQHIARERKIQINPPNMNHRRTHHAQNGIA